MTKITELPDKWRNCHRTQSWTATALNLWCAQQLESALPVWTEITDDPKTWPAMGAPVLAYSNRNNPAYIYVFNRRDIHTFEKGYVWAPARWGAVNGLTHWRPFCDLDYPPENKDDTQRPTKTQNHQGG